MWAALRSHLYCASAASSALSLLFSAAAAASTRLGQRRDDRVRQFSAYRPEWLPLIGAGRTFVAAEICLLSLELKWERKQQLEETGRPLQFPWEPLEGLPLID